MCFFFLFSFGAVVDENQGASIERGCKPALQDTWVLAAIFHTREHPIGPTGPNELNVIIYTSFLLVLIFRSFKGGSLESDLLDCDPVFGINTGADSESGVDSNSGVDSGADFGFDSRANSRVDSRASITEPILELIGSWLPSQLRSWLRLYDLLRSQLRNRFRDRNRYRNQNRPGKRNLLR